MDKKSPPEQSVKKILQLIEALIINVDYTNCVYWILGISSNDTPAQTSFFRYLLEQREEYRRLYLQIRDAQKKGRSFLVLNVEDRVTMFEQLLDISYRTKNMWKNDPVKILCSDSKLRDLAIQVKEKGLVELSKIEIEKYFDFSKIVSFWNRIPSYTSFIVGGGIRFSSPEFDLFEAMCWSFNEMVRTNHEMLALRSQVEKTDSDMSVFYVYGYKLSKQLIMCRQTVINAFLLVEAFINSVADSSLADPTRNYTNEQKLHLRERAKDKNDNERQKFVPIEIKLCEWTKIISHTGKTFNKGDKLFQEFMKVKEYRDAIVHLSATKIKKYYLIDFEIAHKAVQLALEMVKKISEYTAPDSNNIEYPFWLAEPQSDGLFHISHTMKFKEIPPTKNHTEQSATLDHWDTPSSQ